MALDALARLELLDLLPSDAEGVAKVIDAVRVEERERIAAAIEHRRASFCPDDAGGHGFNDGLVEAARIARAGGLR